MNATVKRTFEQEIVLTPEEAAKVFAEFDAGQQASFFNALASEFKLWDRSFCFQFQAITDSPELNDDARYVMHQIGAYSGKQL